ncbi:GNAT family N-acetyltransferase [Clostridium sp. YIM B02505]|uniref:GNAT family N-acetyltransferase n=1 Tax=Clostridium yunnanense TaxID=2800325 RepID=A0ABS1ERS5_9CLOT|nr:GNAT family N-acetyltransferase [Clostridium yunnanense]MBK1812093.1 GNAT family N-acetyltransferase [Clostridium yunnanense]
MLSYRFTDEKDVHLLVSLRLDFLELIPTDENYYEIKENLKKYFEEKMANKSCVVMLAEDNAAIIGTGMLFFYDSVPSIKNKTGKSAHITNLYVHQSYRKQKIGTLILTKLVEFAREKECYDILLNASYDSKELFSRHGFKKEENSMIYEVPNKKLTKDTSELYNANPI